MKVLLFIICGIIRAEPESARVYCHVTVFLLEWQINIILGTIYNCGVSSHVVSCSKLWLLR